MLKNFRNHQSSWSPSIFPFWKQKDIKIDPFNTTCIGILTSKTFEVTLHVTSKLYTCRNTAVSEFFYNKNLITDVDNWQLFKFLVGIILFFYAKKLSDNQLFYYICGISLGICGSIAILIYLFSRLLPNVSTIFFYHNRCCDFDLFNFINYRNR